MMNSGGFESTTALPISSFLRAGLGYLNSQVPIIEHNYTGGISSISTAMESVTEGSNVTVNPYSGDSGDLYQVPLSIIIVLSILYGGISATALIGNLLVLWVVMVSRRMRTVTNMFIANLALADIIIGLFAIPFQFQAALLQRWNLPDFMCAFCPFVQVLSVNISVFTLSAIALDRYRAVLFPLSARVSKRKATWAILTIWSLGIGLALPTELDYKVIQIMDRNGNTKPFCTNLGLSPTFRTYYTLGIVVVQYFFPLIIISVAYAHMATKLWGTTAPGNKEELRDAVVIKMLALVVLLFALCWLPLQTYYFAQTLIPSINAYQYINIIWFCFHWLAMSNSCYNPFIYAIYNDKFQREFRARLWCFRRARQAGYDATYSEASDFDRSKIRASYRFTNNRSMRQSRHSIYSSGRTTTTTASDFRRNSSCNSRRSGLNNHRLSCDRTGSSFSPQFTRQQNQCRLSPEYDSCGGSSRHLGSTGERTYCTGRCSIVGMESSGSRKTSSFSEHNWRTSEDNTMPPLNLDSEPKSETMR
ncbi:Tachykinin-like peptide receptor 99D, partial [Orchesella cincta]